MDEKDKIRRCAIYTRKSLEDTVEKDYNSIDAQRDAGESYVASQKANGWRLIPDRYDDYGFGGGDINRPALKRLLADCEARKVDVVVIYKLDRLSRSICDFAELSKKFDQWGVSLVAVTQEINTATSAGRMMLNILVTFAQYEREVIAERIRDKFAASRKKGMWMGGPVPLGYRVENRRLVVVPEEAEIVRRIFRRYSELQSPRQVALELNRDGLLNRGHKWNLPMIQRLLARSVYTGKVDYKGESYEGEQEAIVDEELWRAAHEAGNAAPSRRESLARSLDGIAPLKGILRCGCCDGAMTPTFTYKNGRKYCFYVCATDIRRAEPSCPVRRLPAGEVEGFVFGQLARLVKSPEVLAALGGLTGLPPAQVAKTLGDEPFAEMSRGEMQSLAAQLLASVTVKLDEIEMELRTAGMEDLAKEVYNDHQS